MRLLIVILMLALAAPVALGDGMPKKKRRHRRPKVVKVVRKPKPRQPSLLWTDFEQAVSPRMRPLLPLLDIPEYPAPELPALTPWTETTVEVYPFEEHKKGLAWWWWLPIGGAAVGVIAHGGSHPGNVPIPVVVVPPTSTPTETPKPQEVPEPSSLVLLLTGISLVYFCVMNIRRRKL